VLFLVVLVLLLVVEFITHFIVTPSLTLISPHLSVPFLFFHFPSTLPPALCMSQKTEKPVLSGQRIKTRKRGE
jgi:hypothetical protein